MEISVSGKSYFLNKFEQNEEELFDFGNPENYSSDPDENIDMIFSISDKINENSENENILRIKKIKYLHINEQGKRSSFIFPPEGPLPEYSICSSLLSRGYKKCKGLEINGKIYHQPNCRNPVYHNLHLSVEGFFELVIQKENFPSLSEEFSWADIREKWQRGEITKRILNCIFEENNITDIGNGNFDCPGLKIENGIPRLLPSASSSFTKIMFYEMEKKRGPKKETLPREAASIIFLTIGYPGEEGECSVKIMKKGLIKIDKLKENIPISDIIILLQDTINYAISVSDESFNKDAWRQLTGSDEFFISTDPQISYNYEISGGFRIYPKDDSISKLNINALHEILVGNIHNSDKTIIMPNAVFDFQKYEFWFKPNTIEKSPTGWLRDTLKEGVECFPIQGKRNPSVYLKLNFSIRETEFNISINFQSAGGVQFTANSEKNMSQEILNFIKGNIFNENIIAYLESNLSNFIYNDTQRQDKQIKLTTRTGKKPSIVRISSGTKGQNIRKTRPEPYNFSSTCADPDFFIHPGGKLNKEDDLFYPACEKLTEKSKKELKKILKDGFPADDQHVNKFKVPSNSQPDVPDEFSAVIPLFNLGDTIDIKMTPNGQYNTKATLLQIMPKKNNVSVKLKNTGEVKQIPRTFILPEDRRFKGLERHQALHILKDYGLLQSWIDTNKEDINNALLQNNFFNEEEKHILYSQDSSLVRNTDQVNNFLQIYNSITNQSHFLGSQFSEIKNSDFSFMKEEYYYVFHYPKNCLRAMLVVLEDNAFVVLENMAVTQIKQIQEGAPSGIILDGYCNPGKNGKYYPMDILYYNDSLLNNMLYKDRLQILLSIYDENELNISPDILMKSSQVSSNNNLVFIPSGHLNEETSFVEGNFSPYTFHFKTTKTLSDYEPTINLIAFQNIKNNNWQVGVKKNSDNMLIPDFDEVEIGKVQSRKIIPGETVITCKIIFYNNEYYKLYFDGISENQTLSYDDTLSYIDYVKNRLISSNFKIEKYENNQGWLINNVFYSKNESSELENGLYTLNSIEL